MKVVLLAGGFGTRISEESILLFLKIFPNAVTPINVPLVLRL